MDDKFTRIKSALKNNTFKQLDFSDQMKSKIQQQINLEHQREDLYLDVLQILVKEKTGYELIQLLQSRGNDTIQGNEGMLYTVLHALEKERLLISNWDEEAAKYYRISDKGRKVLARLETENEDKKVSLRKLVEGGLRVEAGHGNLFK